MLDQIFAQRNNYDNFLDRSIWYNDPDINLDIHSNVIVSKKDLLGKSLKEAKYF